MIKFDQKTRGVIYRVLVAVLPLLVFYGVLSDAAAAQWVAAIAGVFGFGLASANTPLE